MIPLSPEAMDQLMGEALAEARRRQAIRRVRKVSAATWPERHIADDNGQPVPFHRAQDLAWEATERIVGLIAGTQGGKTKFGPPWLLREILTHGAGDYLAITSTFQLFNVKMLPALLHLFEHVLGIGRYWTGARILEIADPETGAFRAKRVQDPMWARIILRSAEAEEGLEAATAKAAWADEAGQDAFSIDTYRAIRRRLALHQGRLLLTTTLYNLGWLVQHIIVPAQKGGKTRLENVRRGGEIEVTRNAARGIALFQYDSIVNPAFPLPEWQEAQRDQPADEFAMFYRGRVAQLRTLIYDAFNLLEHTTRRFDLPRGWKRYWGVDFGGANMAAVKFAVDPGPGTLYGYATYHAGNKPIADHVKALLEGELGHPNRAWGGSKSEEQWREEFAQNGLSLHPPSISDVWVGIQRVYAGHRQGRIVYFDDLEELFDEKGRYRRKRDRSGNVLEDIEDKHSFHLMDAERYVVQEVLSDTPGRWASLDRLGQVTAEEGEEWASPYR